MARSREGPPPARWLQAFAEGKQKTFAHRTINFYGPLWERLQRRGVRDGATGWTPTSRVPHEGVSGRKREQVVSIEDVAHRAGVSVATVSRALRGLPNVATETRLRVEAAARDLDYVSSPSAARLAAGRTGTMPSAKGTS